ncbi:hypothetical protein B0H17DRAFT_1206532 [Mycena rosella]|uniref:Uncharacterized protein n=1 Tax=Mycena rosella TaxID=1033263 RepID=A0AAD7GCV8_MYCRO|nr:hypothetical protein B0H17DRAFT_1206532 [Mycena rosella]
MPDISVDVLSECQNKLCNAGCSQFYGSFEPGVAIGRARCDICGCFAAQRVPRKAVPNTGAGLASDLGGVPSAPAPVPPSFVPPAAPSATANTLSGSRTAPPPPPGVNPLTGSTSSGHAFRTLAQLRQQGYASANPQATFNPVLKAAKEADLDPLAAGSRKRKRKGGYNPSTSANVRSVKPRMAPQSKFVVVLVPHTKLVADNRCTAQKRSWFCAGHVLPSGCYPGDIQEAMKTAFEHIDGVTDSELRVLRTIQATRRDSKGRKVTNSGMARMLTPLKLGLSLSALKTALTDSNVRGAGPRFKKSIFIALTPEGPNIRFDEAISSSDEEPSEESDKSDSTTQTMSDQDGETTTEYKSTDPDSHNASGKGKSSAKATGDDQAPAPNAKNSKGKQKATYALFYDMCATICNTYIQTPGASVLAPAPLLEFIRSQLIQPFAPLVKLSNRPIGRADYLGTSEFESKFDEQFAVGPGGLHGIIDSMAPAYLTLLMIEIHMLLESVAVFKCP